MTPSKLSEKRGDRFPRIFILPVPHDLQPEKARFRYPSYSLDWGIEQDFLYFLKNTYPCLVDKEAEADFLYLPVFWTRYHLNHEFGANGREFLEEAVSHFVERDKPLFTICQYDDGPLVNLGRGVTFLGSRKNPKGQDAPLLASPLPVAPKNKLERGIFANFTGRENTHPIRTELINYLRTHPRVKVSTKRVSARSYARTLDRSLITIAPRGYGGSSFRFFEAIQRGSVPWLIGDLDTRPFKNFIDWDSGSYYSKNVEDFILHFESLNLEELKQKQKSMLAGIQSTMSFGNWCWLLIAEISDAPSQRFVPEGKQV